MSVIDEVDNLEESKSGHEKEIDFAKEALKRADTQELFDLFQKAITDRERLLLALNVMGRHYEGKSLSPRYQPVGEDVVQSMERVALAAIELAKAVAFRANEEG